MRSKLRSDALVSEASDAQMHFYARDDVVFQHVPRFEQLLRYKLVSE